MNSLLLTCLMHLEKLPYQGTEMSQLLIPVFFIFITSGFLLFSQCKLNQRVTIPIIFILL